MAILINKSAVIEKVLKSDEGLPKEQQTIFRFATLTLRDASMVENTLKKLTDATDPESVLDVMTETMALILDSSGWRNLKDPKTGADYTLAQAVADKFEIFPMALVSEIIETALEVNRLSETDQGN